MAVDAFTEYKKSVKRIMEIYPINYSILSHPIPYLPFCSVLFVPEKTHQTKRADRENLQKHGCLER